MLWVMEENSIFGPYLNLPDVPGLRSPCETELLLFLKEIDAFFEANSQIWQAKLDAADSVRLSQKKEIEKLKNALKNIKKELNVKSSPGDEENCEVLAAKCVKAVNDSKNNNDTWKKRCQKAQQVILVLENNTEILENAIRDLKEELYKKDKKLKHMEFCYQKVLQFLDDLQTPSKKHELHPGGFPPKDHRNTGELDRITDNFMIQQERRNNILDSKIAHEAASLQRLIEKELNMAFSNS